MFDMPPVLEAISGCCAGSLESDGGVISGERCAVCQGDLSATSAADGGQCASCGAWGGERRSALALQADFLRTMAEARRLIAGIREAVKRC
jgi:hypothetical protein